MTQLQLIVNKSRKFIDDISGKTFTYMVVPVYTNGYHLNVSGDFDLEGAHYCRQIIEAELSIKILSINEGRFS